VGVDPRQRPEVQKSPAHVPPRRKETFHALERELLAHRRSLPPLELPIRSL
jgi:hypothetical protein